jgi:hypothetical protein
VKWVWPSLFLATIVALAWCTRWQAIETHPAAGSSDVPAIFLVNRWTGEVRYLTGRGSIPVDPVQ